MRGYISIITILRGIAAGNQESLFGHRPVRHFDLISFRFIFEILRKSLSHIRQFSSAFSLREFQAHQSIEADPASAEKRAIVCRTIIQIYDLPVVDNFESFSHVHRYTQMAGKSIARTYRNDSQCRGSIDKLPGYFVASSVSAYGQHDVHTFVHGPASQFGSMPRILCKNTFHPIFRRFYYFPYQSRDFFLIFCSRYRIYNS